MDPEAARELWIRKLGGPALQSTADASQDKSYRPTAATARGRGVAPLPRAAPCETLGLIGSGGMGAIFRARQAELEREIALKKLKPGNDSPRDRESFLAEAVVNGQLEHPNIVPVYGLGIDAADDICLSMKLVQGDTWKTLIRETRKGDLLFHLETLLQVCNAVAYAHSKSIIHNDLKPSNVMIGPFGEVLVLDWGLAVSCRPTDSTTSRVRHRTSISSPVGTPAYMAPELATGQGGKLGPWTDVYLLGATLFEILTGRPPHRQGSLSDAVAHAVRGEIPPLPPDAPAELRALCARALARYPGERHQTVREFQTELRTYLRHRESLELTARARAQLRACEGRAASGPGERSALYADFAATVASFDHARALWEGNPDAASGERAARTAYARAALRNGDLGLAAAALAPLPPEEADAENLRAEVAEAIAARKRARRRRRLLARGLALTMLAAIVALAALLAFLERENARLAREAARATEQRRYADRREAIAAAALSTVAAEVALPERGPVAARRAALLGAALEGWRGLLATHLEEAPRSSETALARLRVKAGRELEAAAALVDSLWVARPGDAELEAAAQEALFLRGRIAEQRGDDLRAEAGYRAAAAGYAALCARDPRPAWRERLAHCRASLGRVLLELGRADEAAAERAAAAALEISLRRSDEPAPAREER